MTLLPPRLLQRNIGTNRSGHPTGQGEVRSPLHNGLAVNASASPFCATNGHHVPESSTADIGVLAGQATGGRVAGAALMAIYYERLIVGTALQRLPGTLRMYNSSFELVNGLVGATKPSAQLAPETRK
jgi:hypothetical protein